MKTNHGMALVEILIGAAIISAGIIAATSSYGAYVSYALANQRNIQASYLLQEGLETITYFRDKSWSGNISKLSTTTTYYLSWDNTDWATSTSPQYVDGTFLRSIRIYDVFRDGNYHIASSGTFDSNTRKITATVSYWQGHATTTRSISTYIANIYAN